MASVIQLKRGFCLLGVCLFIGSNLVLFTPGRPHSQVKKGGVYHLVWEKKYEKEIKNAIFNSGEEKAYPKTVVFPDEILFLDPVGTVLKREALIFKRDIVGKNKKEGKVIESIPLEVQVFRSKSGRYLGLFRVLRQTESHEIIESQFRVIDLNGKEVWKKKNPLLTGFEGSMEILISDRDGSISRIQRDGLYYIFGDKIRKITEKLFISRWVYSDEGDYIAAMFKNTSIDPSTRNSTQSRLWILLCDILETELWRRELKDTQIGDKIDISPQGQYIVVTGRKTDQSRRSIVGTSTSLFDKDGKEIPLSEPMYFHLSSFSGDSRFVALSEVVKKRNVKIYETATGRKIFEHEFENRPVKILLSNDGSLLFAETHRVILPKVRDRDLYHHNDAQVFAFNTLTGAMIWSKTFQGEVDGMTPALSAISSNGGQIAFKFENRLAVYGK